MGVLHHQCEKNFEEKFLERLNAKVVYCEHQHCSFYLVCLENTIYPAMCANITPKDIRFTLKEGVKKTFFFGDLSQMWVGGVADSQTRSKPLKTPPNCPENRLFRPKFHLSFSQISQKPWGGWVGKQIWERSPKKNVFLLLPL